MSSFFSPTFCFVFACCFSHVFVLLFWLLLLGVGGVDYCLVLVLLLHVGATTLLWMLFHKGAILLQWCYCCFTLVLCFCIDVIVFCWCCHFACWCCIFMLALHLHVLLLFRELVLLFHTLVLFSTTFLPKHCCCCCFRIGDALVSLISLVFLSPLAMCKSQLGTRNYW